MVDFSVFNELSLPLSDINEFENFFKILANLKTLGLNKIRMDREFTQYYEILPNVTFQQLLGQISDRDKERRLKSFINNSITMIESPLIKIDEEESEQLLENEYFYLEKSTIGALACCDIWNSIAISFNSDEQWNKENIILQKQTIEDECTINIRHSSKVEHLVAHADFFDELEAEKKLNITQINFWGKRNELFPNKIHFCKEVEKQIKNLDKTIFQQAINILREVENDKKSITDYSVHTEGETVKTNPDMIKERTFSIEDKVLVFEKHITSLSNGNRLYFIEDEDKIYIGYIGKHLTTKNF